ncbi:hypothetical protein FRC12_024227 [Ceratobasidium sp. 428]|nr:hypothetical protein FRC12_024227 [Ceratobasidium sp. 428]
MSEPTPLSNKRGPPSPTSSLASHKRKKTRSERRRQAKATASGRFARSVKKLSTILGKPAYSRPEIREIRTFLDSYYGYLNNICTSSDAHPIKESDAYLKVLIDVIDCIGAFAEVINQAVIKAGNTEGVNTTIRAHWPFFAQERYQPMLDFVRTSYPVHVELKITRMKLALGSFKHKIAVLNAITKKIKSTQPQQQSEEKELRLQLQLLITTERLHMTHQEADALELEDLRTIVDKNKKNLGCDVFSIEDLHKNHGCATCKDKPSSHRGKYNSPADGSGTPQIQGLFPSGPVSVEDLNKHHIRYITGGTTCGLAHYPGAETPELAFFCDFPNYHSLTPEGCARLERLAYLIHLGATFSSPCHSNQAHQAIDPKIRGKMNVVGNRTARDSKPWGPYAVPSRFKGKRRPEYLDFHKDCVPEITVILNMIFNGSYSHVVAQRARDFVGKELLPPLGSISIDEITWTPSMGCNLTISFNNFTNEVHLDKDGYRYVFSVYVFVDSATGQLITNSERIAKCMKGGYLFWPDLHLALRIVHCTGVVLLFWRGTHERHATILSETVDPSVTRYGTSLQVNKKLFNAVTRYHEQLQALERWELNGGQGPCPPFPQMPTDWESLSVTHK